MPEITFRPEPENNLRKVLFRPEATEVRVYGAEGAQSQIENPGCFDPETPDYLGYEGRIPPRLTYLDEALKDQVSAYLVARRIFERSSRLRRYTTWSAEQQEYEIGGESRFLRPADRVTVESSMGIEHIVIDEVEPFEMRQEFIDAEGARTFRMVPCFRYSGHEPGPEDGGVK